MLPSLLHVRGFKVINRELQLVLITNLAVLYFPAGLRIARPHNVINTVHVLEKRRNALQSIGEFGADGIQIDSTALLEISELRNPPTTEHHLPAHAPCGQSGRF